MPTHNTSDLEGALLDAAVAKAAGFPSFWIDPGDEGREQACVLGPARAQDARFDWCPSTAWEQGGPILERERIGLIGKATEWVASRYVNESTSARAATGPTPLIAAMRAYVASKLGETVELP